MSTLDELTPDGDRHWAGHALAQRAELEIEERRLKELKARVDALAAKVELAAKTWPLTKANKKLIRKMYREYDTVYDRWMTESEAWRQRAQWLIDEHERRKEARRELDGDEDEAVADGPGVGG